MLRISKTSIFNKNHPIDELIPQELEKERKKSMKMYQNVFKTINSG